MANFYTNVAVMGKNILYRGIFNGKRVRSKVEYRPTFYVPSQDGKGDWRSIEGNPLSQIQPGNISDCREFLSRYEDVSNFKIYGNNKYEYAFISDEFDGMIEWNADQVRVAYLDIEVASDNGFPHPDNAMSPITAITLLVEGKYFVFGTKPYTSENENVRYIFSDTEEEMLTKFLKLWGSVYPDIISGWNVEFFDIPYIVNRINRVLPENAVKALSPWGMIKPREMIIMNKTNYVHDLIGIATIDYLQLYKKYRSASKESYKLDYIAEDELGEKKLDYRSMGYSTLHEFYVKDYKNYINYNIRDVELVAKLDVKLKLMYLVMTLAYDAKVNFKDVFTQVRMWDTIIYNALKKNKVAIPQNTKHSKTQMYEGAHVKPPIVGFHKCVVSFDLDSLYPHLIMQYCMSPETLVPRDVIDARIAELEKHVSC